MSPSRPRDPETIHLPGLEPDGPERTTPAPEPPSSELGEKPPLLLIAEDDLPLRNWLSKALLTLGFRVTLAADGVEAVTAALQVQPDVILMDLGLPAMDGLQATTAIKRDARTRHIPVIAFTGYSGGSRQRARDAGCDAFVAKPCTPDDIAIQARLLLAEKRAAAGQALKQLGESERKPREGGGSR